MAQQWPIIMPGVGAVPGVYVPPGGVGPAAAGAGPPALPVYGAPPGGVGAAPPPAAPKVAKAPKPAAPAGDSITWDQFTIGFDKKDYTPAEIAAAPANTFHYPAPEPQSTARIITTRTLPRGTILWNYMYLTETPTGSDSLYGSGIPPEILSVVTVVRSINAESIYGYARPGNMGPHGQVSPGGGISFCFNTQPNRTKYFYPVPIAGWGVSSEYNAAAQVVLTRDAKVIISKDGGLAFPHLTSKYMMHRRYPIIKRGYGVWLTHFDYLRLMQCDMTPEQGSGCRDATTYDLCVRPTYAKANQIDAVEAIAFPDGIYHWPNSDNVPGAAPNQSVGQSHRMMTSSFQTMNDIIRMAEGLNTAAEIVNSLRVTRDSMYLPISGDNREGSQIVGMPEYAFLPTGHKFESRPPHENESPIPKGANGQPLYYPLNKDPSRPAAYNYFVPTEQFDEFVRRFVLKNSPFKVVGFATQEGVYDFAPPRGLPLLAGGLDVSRANFAINASDLWLRARPTWLPWARIFITGNPMLADTSSMNRKYDVRFNFTRTLKEKAAAQQPGLDLGATGLAAYDIQEVLPNGVTNLQRALLDKVMNYALSDYVYYKNPASKGPAGGVNRYSVFSASAASMMNGVKTQWLDGTVNGIDYTSGLTTMLGPIVESLIESIGDVPAASQTDSITRLGIVCEESHKSIAVATPEIPMLATLIRYFGDKIRQWALIGAAVMQSDRLNNKTEAETNLFRIANVVRTPAGGNRKTYRSRDTNERKKTNRHRGGRVAVASPPTAPVIPDEPIKMRPDSPAAAPDTEERMGPGPITKEAHNALVAGMKLPQFSAFFESLLPPMSDADKEQLKRMSTAYDASRKALEAALASQKR